MEAELFGAEKGCFLQAPTVSGIARFERR